MAQTKVTSPGITDSSITVAKLSLPSLSIDCLTSFISPRNLSTSKLSSLMSFTYFVAPSCCHLRSNCETLRVY